MIQKKKIIIEVSELLIEDLHLYHNTDEEHIVNGFFVGQWADGTYGDETMITLSYQVIRTKHWNNGWYLEQ